MLRIKDRVVIGPEGATFWRERRAKSLARMMAWRRIIPSKFGKDNIRRIIIEDIIPDCGWPRRRWLSRQVREEERRIRSLVL